MSNALSLLEVVGASDAVDASLRRSGGHTDLGEMAQIVAVEILTRLGTLKTASLFDTTAADFQQTFKNFSIINQFSTLAREFTPSR